VTQPKDANKQNHAPAYTAQAVSPPSGKSAGTIPGGGLKGGGPVGGGAVAGSPDSMSVGYFSSSVPVVVDSGGDSW
jgi:hypothetical protein